MIAARGHEDTTRWGGALALVAGLHLAAGFVVATLARPVERALPEDPAMFIDLPAAEATPSQPPPSAAQPTPVDPAPVQPDTARPVPEVASVALPDRPVVQRVEPAPAPVMTPSPAPPLANAPQAVAEPVSDAMRARELNYYASLMAWLNRKKTYPAEARKARQQGVVSVRFTIDRNGNVISAGIKKGSGFALLDDETLKLMQRASPLPAIPDSLKKQQLTISLPVEYSLVTQ